MSKKILGKIFLLLIIFLSITLLTRKNQAPLARAQVVSNDWPQLQKDPQRTGHSLENITSSISNSWAVGFATTFAPARERLHPQVQPVVASGKVFIGTEMGTFYALSATSGAKAWQYPPTGQPRVGPIIGTGGAENGKVFFGSLDGNVYALNIADGSLAWKFNAGAGKGFSSSVLLAESKVFLPTRSGIYYALNQTDGTVAWQKNIGTPIFMSSAYNNGKIYFGAMNMRVYALSSANGTIAWQSNPVPGTAFKDYWPVVHKGYVFIRPFRVEGGTVTASQSDISTWSLFALAESDGAFNFFPHAIGITMNGTTCPPPVDRDGYLIIPWESDWKRLNVDTKQIAATWVRPGVVNPDENMCASTAGNYAILMHTMEANAQFTGVWNLSTNATTGLGKYQADRACGDLSGCFESNTQGGGTSPAAISNGYIYHNAQNTLNARKAVVN